MLTEHGPPPPVPTPPPAKAMTESAFMPSPDEGGVAAPPDRKRRMTWGQALTMALSILVLAAAVFQARSLRVEDITAMVPTSPLFWIVFPLSYLAGPAGDWLIFRKLWGVSASALGALTRKLIYNELLLGYVGEAYIYAWAKRRLSPSARPFGVVKDVAIMSALAGNIMTLALIALAYPYLTLLPLAEYGKNIAWSLAFVIGISLVPLVWRRQIFSLSRSELWIVFGIHMARIWVATLLSAVLWALVLPDVAIGWWVVLSALRLLVGRLPFVPNKDIVFAGIAVLALGQDVAISALMAMMAALILATHLLLALFFGLNDLLKGERT